jgi:chemotaxis protein CheD
MELSNKSHIKRIRIKPGEYHVATRNVIITTLLGSCVSACLYDPVRKIIGMNHFLLSNKRYAKNMPVCVTEAGRYGIHAMELLINEMLKAGARRDKLQAKAFGGGSLLEPSANSDNFYCVGEVNMRFIREFLANEDIPLVTADLGGDTGRVIHFCFDDFSVYVRKIQKTINRRLINEERHFWKNSIEKQEAKITTPDVELWG